MKQAGAWQRGLRLSLERHSPPPPPSTSGGAPRDGNGRGAAAPSRQDRRSSPAAGRPTACRRASPACSRRSGRRHGGRCWRSNRWLALRPAPSRSRLGGGIRPSSLSAPRCAAGTSGRSSYAAGVPAPWPRTGSRRRGSRRHMSCRRPRPPGFAPQPPRGASGRRISVSHSAGGRVRQSFRYSSKTGKAPGSSPDCGSHSP